MHILRWTALASDVIAVAVARPHDGDGAWTAYIKAVPGKRHVDEYMDVVHWGDILPPKVAVSIFPEQVGKSYVY